MGQNLVVKHRRVFDYHNFVDCHGWNLSDYNTAQRIHERRVNAFNGQTSEKIILVDNFDFQAGQFLLLRSAVSASALPSCAIMRNRWDFFNAPYAESSSSQSADCSLSSGSRGSRS